MVFGKEKEWFHWKVTSFFKHVVKSNNGCISEIDHLSGLICDHLGYISNSEYCFHCQPAADVRAENKEGSCIENLFSH